MATRWAFSTCAVNPIHSRVVRKLRAGIQVFVACNTQNIKKLVGGILCEAASQGARSIAFSTFGTGTLSYPPGLVADAMYTAVDEFDASSSGSSLKDVRVVVYFQNLPVYLV